MSAAKKKAAAPKQQTRNFPRTILVTDAAYHEFAEAAELLHHCGHGTAGSMALIDWARKIKAQYTPKN